MRYRIVEMPQLQINQAFCRIYEKKLGLNLNIKLCFLSVVELGPVKCQVRERIGTKWSMEELFADWWNQVIEEVEVKLSKSKRCLVGGRDQGDGRNGTVMLFGSNVIDG